MLVSAVAAIIVEYKYSLKRSMAVSSGSAEPPASGSRDAQSTIASLCSGVGQDGTSQPMDDTAAHPFSAIPRLSCAVYSCPSSKKMPRSLFSSAVRPAVLRTATDFFFAMPEETVRLVVRYIGAHNLESVWECAACNPYWYNWFCEECQRHNWILYWTSKKHFGNCGEACGCCRTAISGVGCSACEDLWYLKVTCHRMQDGVKRYNGL